jgi:hypothetical protein
MKRNVLTRKYALPLAVLLLVTAFWALQSRFPPGFHRPQQVPGQDRVVLPPSLQVVLGGGDRYLAANVETFRVMSAGMDETGAAAAAEGAYRVRAYDAATQLNPCHEDAFSTANALLTWGGAPIQGINVLRRATACRSWDTIPAFYLGLALGSALKDGPAARAALEQAAERARSPEQTSSFKRIGLMLEAGTFRETEAALAFLRHEWEASNDERLRTMLVRRIERLEGLKTLEDAQAAFEQRHGRPLQAPNELLESGLLPAFPLDPLGIGYVFVDGRFALKSND